MKNKFFISDQQIRELVKKGNSIVSVSEVNRLQRLGKKLDIDLTSGKKANLGIFWAKILSMLRDLPEGDPFRENLIASRQWHNRLLDQKIVLDFIRYKKLWDEYEFLCSPAWGDLEQFTTDLRQLGCDPKGAEFIKNGADYEGFLSQYSRKNCDPDLLKKSTTLRKQIDVMFASAKSDADRWAVLAAVEAASLNPSLDEAEFHNLIFAGS